MWIAIIPALNEAKSIKQTMQSLIDINIDCIILVANGCKDNTISEAAACFTDKPLLIISYAQALGIDIPRAIGAVLAKKFSPSGVIFVDGDMNGIINTCLHDLINSINSGIDLSLTNCYPYIYNRTDLAKSVLKQRELLNRKLAVFNKIGLATPSHGPHAISYRLLMRIPPEIIALPPMTLTYAVKNNFKVEVAASIPHNLLGSISRNNSHAELIAQTIKVDCQNALKYFSGTPLKKIITRCKMETAGYSTLRRFDILEDFISIYDKTKGQL